MFIKMNIFQSTIRDIHYFMDRLIASFHSAIIASLELDNLIFSQPETLIGGSRLQQLKQEVILTTNEEYN